MSHLYFLRTPRRTKNSTSFLKISSYTFGTVYSRKHIGLELYFNSKPTGYIFRVTSITLNNSSKKSTG